MKTGRKMLLWFLLGTLLLLASGLVLLGEYLTPSPERVFAHMERKDPEQAQEILDNCTEPLQTIAATTASLSSDASCFYVLNSDTSWNEEVLHDMPPELTAALEKMEADFPDRALSLLLRQGQVGVSLSSDGNGFSYLCYPKGEFISRSVLSDEEGIRCVDMGGGWELQMYYAPKG